MTVMVPLSWSTALVDLALGCAVLGRAPSGVVVAGCAVSGGFAPGRAVPGRGPLIPVVLVILARLGVGVVLHSTLEGSTSPTC